MAARWEQGYPAPDDSSRTCPRCRVGLQAQNNAFELVRKANTSVEPLPALSVAVYVCPRCGYIELYNLRVLGRI